MRHFLLVLILGGARLSAQAWLAPLAEGLRVDLDAALLELLCEFAHRAVLEARRDQHAPRGLGFRVGGLKMKLRFDAIGELEVLAP